MADPDRPGEDELEPTLDVETSPMMEPSSALVCEIPVASSARSYWDAQRYASTLHAEFEELEKKGDHSGMRQRFYMLARYYSRTLGILRSALSRGRKPLITAALHNLVALHEPMHHMHELAPGTVPFVLTVDEYTRGQLAMDTIVETVQESGRAMTPEEIAGKLMEKQFMARLTRKQLDGHLASLMERGFLAESTEGLRRTSLGYNAVNMDTAGLRAILGESLYMVFEKSGFPSLSSLTQKKSEFLMFFDRFSGCGEDMAELFIVTATELTEAAAAPEATVWKNADLNGSPIPRPYQRQAYNIFKGYGYQGLVIEAPTGSGKTLIGMMVIQDWLRRLSRGQSILVLVPTVNYMQQWLRELSYKPIGLQLPANEVYIGTPGDLEAMRRRSGFTPSILVLTYTALSQIGSPRGKGGFDTGSIERFLQGNNVRYVMLDEVHKSVDDMSSVSADVTRLLVDWLSDGSINGLVGFSGTAAAYRERFNELGLKLVYTLPAADLIAYGFVAPFAEMGVPFAYSDRERRVMDLLDEYKELLKRFLDDVGAARLRELFAAIPHAERVRLGRDLLGMYKGRKDRDEALAGRFKEWEQGGDLSLLELPLVAIVQVHWSLPDAKLAEGEAEETYRVVHARLLEVREELSGLIFFPEIVEELSAGGFGEEVNSTEINHLLASGKRRAARARRLLSTCMAGLYMSLRSLYYRVGEGRVDVIKSIIRAEKRIRKVTGVIVFDRGRRIQWQRGTATPGYTGVGGLFSQMQGDPELTPMAVLSSEMYLPVTPGEPLTDMIARFIKEEVMFKELGDNLFKLLTRGTVEPTADLKMDFDDLLGGYVEQLTDVGAARRGEFQRKVLRKLRATIRRKHKPLVGSGILDRLSVRNMHVRNWVDQFYDYALIVNRFTGAAKASLRQGSGAEKSFYVVKMASGERKRLMYDLASRIVDSGTLPINAIIVSTWARTGWNVVTPNLLIDATATRNVTAWQQLRGRAMRAMPSWNKPSYEAMMSLMGTSLGDAQPDEQEHVLDEASRKLLAHVHREHRSIQGEEPDDVITGKIHEGRLDLFTEQEKQELAVDLMIIRNKVTHIYELVKAYGSTTQVTYSRAAKRWKRRSPVAAKHASEYSVNPFTGSYSAGEDHAPLLYPDDPRENLPSKLETYIADRLAGKDPLIVEGWIKAVVTGDEEEPGVE